ncbi:uncharacterized protein LOC142328367 [Lycorma delicatula]|uniref:uncharacterized protein LOC142328367 n=1 Tax=Lycorma delicatula TaxID=130591 RepID=UPI003F5124ED
MDLYALNNRPRGVVLGIEEENKVLKGYNILKCEVSMTMKAMANEKAGGCDELPTELFKALGENREILLDLFNKIYDVGRWPTDFLDTIEVPLTKKFNARKCE